MSVRAASRAPSFADRSPVSRALRAYLVRAMLTLFAILIMTAFLLPLLSMVTLALQDAGQRTTPGAPWHITQFSL